MKAKQKGFCIKQNGTKKLTYNMKQCVDFRADADSKFEVLARDSFCFTTR